MSRRAALAVALGLLSVGAPRGVAGAAPPAADPAAVRAALRAAEGKALLPVLRAAVKGDHRRQALWVAARLRAAVPDHAEAGHALATWTPDRLQDGEAPSRGFVAARDAALKRLVAEHVAALKALEAAGAPAADTRAVAEAGLGLGPTDPTLRARVARDGDAWCGGFGAVPTAVLEAAFGPRAPAVEFPPPWDDATLRVRAAWPEARALVVGCLRYLDGDAPAAAFGRAAKVAAVEAHLLSTFGDAAKEDRDPERAADALVSLVSVPDGDTLVRLAKALATPGGRAPVDGPETASRWWEPWRRVAVVMRGHRDNPWVPPDAGLLGFAAWLAARRHWVVPAGGRTWDAGTWVLLDGIAGTYEGFVPAGASGGELDPAGAWRLAAARALDDRGAFVPWATLLETPGTGTVAAPREDVRLVFAGAEREAKRLLPASAQATALVAALARREASKGGRRFAAYVAETAKRGSAPDLDKAFGVRPGTVAAWVAEDLAALRR